MSKRLTVATLLALAPGAALAAVAPPAGKATAKPAARPAASAPANRDTRCLLLSNLYAKAAAHSEGQAAAAQARLFYLGRVSGRLSGAALTNAMTAAAKTVSPEKAGADMNACLATVQSSAASVEAAGKTVRQIVIPGASAPANPVAGPANR
ncbi:hypothetical protein [Sphingomonas sp.]|uniref:hypothetical protein n=1 Tax=Sphingomonas sp. TaxID=28214 RepID=UPI003AFFB37F